MALPSGGCASVDDTLTSLLPISAFTIATATAHDNQSSVSPGEEHMHRKMRTFPRPSQLINRLRRVKELPFELCQLEPCPLQLLVLVRNTSANQAEPARRLLARVWRRLVAKVALDKRANFLVMEKDRVLANARKPALEHDLHQPVVLLVRRRRRARKWERGHESLWVVLYDCLVELLELVIGAGHIAVRRPREVRQVRLIVPVPTVDMRTVQRCDLMSRRAVLGRIVRFKSVPARRI